MGLKKMHVLGMESLQVSIQQFARHRAIKCLMQIVILLEHSCGNVRNTTVSDRRRDGMKCWYCPLRSRACRSRCRIGGVESENEVATQQEKQNTVEYTLNHDVTCQ